MAMPKTFFITATGTDAGKTVLTTLLAAWLRQQGVRVAALKPLCSGGRADAEALRAALGGTLSLDEINPWHFRASIAPVLAARREKISVTRRQVLAFIRARQKAADLILVEGAGGLRSPLGEKFDALDLIVALNATPLIVAPNRLGVVNHLLLTLNALPARLRSRARVIFMAPEKPDAATPDNAALLAEFFPARQIVQLPWLGRKLSTSKALRQTSVRQALATLIGA
jgi:dethiobiotin synthetase